MTRVQERAARIVDTAIELAEQGGFENVRLRDVAANAGVALGTLYRHFRSKEDLLVAALEREVESVEARMAREPSGGATALERVESHFGVVTRALCGRPKLARAVLRAVSSGEPELTEKVSQFHDRTTRLVVAALRGAEGTPGSPTPHERAVAEMLQQVWFARLVGWSGGLRSQDDVVSGVRAAAALVLDGDDGA